LTLVSRFTPTTACVAPSPQSPRMSQAPGRHSSNVESAYGRCMHRCQHQRAVSLFVDYVVVRDVRTTASRYDWHDFLAFTTGQSMTRYFSPLLVKVICPNGDNLVVQESYSSAVFQSRLATNRQVLESSYRLNQSEIRYPKVILHSICSAPAIPEGKC
jgi:hypothetical protein